MCGIAGFVGKKAINKVIEILIAQENRGKQGAGVAYVKDGKVEVLKAPTSPTKLAKTFKNDIAKLSDITVAIGHNRMPTQGAATFENTHPFLARDSGFALLHNGNFDTSEFKLLLKFHNVKLDGECDSEYFARALELYVAKYGDIKTALEQLINDISDSKDDDFEIVYSYYYGKHYYRSYSYSSHKYAVLVLDSNNNIYLVKDRYSDGYILKSESGIAIVSDVDCRLLFDGDVKIFEPKANKVVVITSNGDIIGDVREVEIVTTTKNEKQKKESNQENKKQKPKNPKVRCENCYYWERRSLSKNLN